MQYLARVIASGQKVLVEPTAVVNKVQYYTKVGNPEKVYTYPELWIMKGKNN